MLLPLILRGETYSLALAALQDTTPLSLYWYKATKNVEGTGINLTATPLNVLKTSRRSSRGA